MSMRPDERLVYAIAKGQMGGSLQAAADTLDMDNLLKLLDEVEQTVHAYRERVRVAQRMRGPRA